MSTTAEADFDAFYASHWRPLLLQTLAISGDLGSAHGATQHAFADLWEHWPHARGEDPVDFVRARAWQLSAWAPRGRMRTRRSEVSASDREVLKALQSVPLAARKALVLTGLSDLPLDTIARVIDEPAEQIDTLLDSGLTKLADSLGTDVSDAAIRLEGLAAVATAAAQPPARQVRRGVQARSWRRIATGVVAALGITLAAGYLVNTNMSTKVPTGPALGPAVTKSMLLTPTSLAPLGNPARWTEQSTTDNTTGTGLNSRCQKQRFADPEGRKALVRTLDFAGRPQRQAVQTIEVSDSEVFAKKAYATAVSWFAGCQEARLQLLSSYEVSGLGDEAVILQFRAEGDQQQPAKRSQNIAVGLARVGQITTWTTITTSSSVGAGVKALTETLNSALYKICGSRLTARCELNPTVKELPPPPSGEALGMLAVADLPPVGTITRGWAGTDAAPSEANPAATSCDEADFVKAGAKPTLTRTFLIPNAKVPDRFGLSETIGTFANPRQAARFFTKIKTAMDTCETRQLSASVGEVGGQAKSRYGSQWASWRLDSEIRDGVSVRFWVGTAQVGRFVAQVSFVPAGDADVDKATFEALVQRARDRLLELAAPVVVSPQTPSASPSDTVSESASPSP